MKKVREIEEHHFAQDHCGLGSHNSKISGLAFELIESLGEQRGVLIESPSDGILHSLHKTDGSGWHGPKRITKSEDQTSGLHCTST